MTRLFSTSADRDAPARHILVVEDEQHLAVGIKFNLQAEGYRVTTFGDGRSALDFVQQHADDVHLIVLDLMLPGMSGYTVCEKLREQGYDIPIMMLSARTLAEDRKRGFEVGTDQYLTKPFDLEEFIARVRNLLNLFNRRKTREPAPAEIDQYEFAEAKINFTNFEVTVAGKAVKMTPLELKLLQYFVQNEGRVIPRQELLEKVWEQPGTIATRAPDQFLMRLRKAFEADAANPRHFLTIRDAGYRFIADPVGESNTSCDAPPKDSQ